MAGPIPPTLYDDIIVKAGHLMSWIYANTISRIGAGGAKAVAQHGITGLAISEVIDGANTFFDKDGPGANVSTADSKKMKEAITWLLTQIPPKFRGPWYSKKHNVMLSPTHVVIDLTSGDVYATRHYFSRKSMNNEYNKGKKHGENSARKQMTQNNQIAKGVK